MKVEIRHSPAFAVARATLAPNESIKAQPGAMMAMSYGVEITAKADGGIMKGLGRMIAGENFHLTTFTAPSTGGWVDLVPEVTGDAFVIDVDANNPLIITKGAWLANENGIEITPNANLSSAFGGEGLVVLNTRGSGQLIGNSYGGIDVHSLRQGEGFIVDTGHLVAWESSVQTNVRKAGGWMNSWKSKEGLVVELRGPGDVITQSRVPNIINTAANSNNNFLGNIPL